jgi:hypothetical protein
MIKKMVLKEYEFAHANTWNPTIVVMEAKKSQIASCVIVFFLS